MKKFIFLAILILFCSNQVESFAQYSRSGGGFTDGLSVSARVGPNLFAGDLNDKFLCVNVAGAVNIRKSVYDKIVFVDIDAGFGMLKGSCWEDYKNTGVYDPEHGPWYGEFKGWYAPITAGVDVEFLQIGKAYNVYKYNPYVGLGFGAMLANPDNTSSYVGTEGYVVDEGVRMALDFYATVGCRMSIKSNWGLLAELRAHIPMGENGDNIDGHSYFNDDDQHLRLGQTKHDLIGEAMVGIYYEFPPSSGVKKKSVNGRNNRKNYLTNRRRYLRNQRRW